MDLLMHEDISAGRLFERIAARDETALAQLYDAFAPRLLGFLHRALESREEAEETLQTVFLRVWREARSRLPEQASVSAYLTQLAREAAVSHGRAAEERRTARAKRGRMRLEASWLPTAAQVALTDQRWELLSKVLRQLPAPQREVIERVVFNGSNEEEVAAFRAEPLGRAQDELRAGLAFLRQRLLTLVGTWTAGI
jgi:RNA polymerase sigma-70 factor, ECF subfamily